MFCFALMSVVSLEGYLGTVLKRKQSAGCGRAQLMELFARMKQTAAQVRRLKMQVPSHFLTFIATFAAVLCVVQALPVAYNISSGGCRSRQYAVDEAVKHASGQE